MGLDAGKVLKIRILRDFGLESSSREERGDWQVMNYISGLFKDWKNILYCYRFNKIFLALSCGISRPQMFIWLHHLGSFLD